MGSRRGTSPAHGPSAVPTTPGRPSIGTRPRPTGAPRTEPVVYRMATVAGTRNLGSTRRTRHTPVGLPCREQPRERMRMRTWCRPPAAICRRRRPASTRPRSTRSRGPGWLAASRCWTASTSSDAIPDVVTRPAVPAGQADPPRWDGLPPRPGTPAGEAPMPSSARRVARTSRSRYPDASRGRCPARRPQRVRFGGAVMVAVTRRGRPPHRNDDRD